MPLARLYGVRPSSIAVAATLATVVLTGSATVVLGQDGTPRDWRRTDMSGDTFGATAVGAEVDGVRRVTVVILAPVDRQPAGMPRFRSIVFDSKVWCGQRLWQISSATYHAADLSVVRRDGPVPEAPLIRETPLHAAISDACDGGYENSVGLTTPDPLDALRWLGAASAPDLD